MATEKKKYKTRQNAAEERKTLLSRSLDPKLWSNLPLDLQLVIYKKLPLPDFHKLCVVCKDWNRVACEQPSLICERRRFYDPVPEPYFVLISQGHNDYATGTLAYDFSVGRWDWEPYRNYQFLDKIGDLYEAFSVEGIIFDGSGLAVGPAVASHRYPLLPSNFLQTLYDIHAREHVLVPKVPRLESSRFRDDLKAEGVLGMMVDTSKQPYSFKLIKGSVSAGTLILDSQTKTWETKPSRLVGWTHLLISMKRRRSVSPKSCIQCDGCVYIWSELYEIHVYSLEKDKWSTLGPPRHVWAKVSKKPRDIRGLGHWQGEIYIVTGAEDEMQENSLFVWRLTNRRRHTWSEFERMPPRLYEWLLQPEGSCYNTIVTTHSNEYLLMHVLALSGPPNSHPEKRGLRYVLFNISTQSWSKVDVRSRQMLTQGS